MPINYSERIPNNVNLADDRRLRRALEAWQPGFLQWWGEMGPETFQGCDASSARWRRRSSARFTLLGIRSE